MAPYPCITMTPPHPAMAAEIESLKQAYAARQPALIEIDTQTVIDANKSRLSPPGPVDQRVGLIKITSAGAGTALAARRGLRADALPRGITLLAHGGLR